jgi:hypothetical protein
VQGGGDLGLLNTQSEIRFWLLDISASLGLASGIM